MKRKHIERVSKTNIEQLSKECYFRKCSLSRNKLNITSKHKKPTKGAFGGMSKFNKKLKEMSKFNKKLKAERDYLNVITSTKFDTLDEHKNIINFNNWNADNAA